jgi:methanogenic corrinoid protein MtbC1
MGNMAEPTNASGTRTVLLAALIDGDVPLAYDLATGLLREGVSFETLVIDVIGPVQVEVGRRWADGDLTIADEHAATAATESLVALLAGTLSPSEGPIVVIACPEGDTHSLPGRVVAATLELRGFRAMFLGASLPAADLGEYLQHQQPMALALSVSMASALHHATQSVAVAHQHGVPVIVGGQALGPDAARSRALGADGFSVGPTEAAELLDRWTVLPPDQLAANARVHSECAVIERVGPRLTATTLDQLTGVDEIAGPRLADELARVLQVVQGTLTVDDPTILAEYVRALRSADRAHGLAPALVDASIAGLAGAMDDRLPDSRALLTALAD